MDPHQMPHNFGGFQNSYNDPAFANLYTNGNDSHYDTSGWNYNAQDDLAASAPQSSSLYAGWNQTDPPLNGYGRPPSKSPSVPFPSYGETRSYQNTPVDPSLVQGPSSIGAQFHMSQSPYDHQPMDNRTIAPQALQHERMPLPRNDGNYNTNQRDILNGYAQGNQPQRYQSAPLVNQDELLATIPQSQISGPFSIIDINTLSSATGSKRMHNFINTGSQDYEYPINKAAVPAPVQRKSRNELRKLGKDNPKLLSKLSKRPKRKIHADIKLQRPQSAAKSPTDVKIEPESSSEEESSDEYSDEDSEDELEISPLPEKRPDDPLGATRYDTIKAVWRPKSLPVSADSVREGLKDFWELARTIRDRWKTDAAAVTQAEEKKRLGELPLLKSRVKDQRNMMEAALKSALEHGHIAILEVFSSNKSFMFVLYQFLLDRTKEGDFNSPIARYSLEILASCTTLTTTVYQETYLNKAVPRFNKGNAETQALVKKVQASIAAATKREAEKKAETGEVTGTDAVTKSTKSAPDAVAGVKRSAPGGAPSAQAPKRVASATNGAAPGAAVSKPAIAPIKRPTTGATTAKTTTPTAAGTPAAKPKQVVAKPSGFFSAPPTTTKKPTPSTATKPASTANAKPAAKPNVEKKASVPAAPMAAAKPAFSFADTMANLTKAKEKEPAPKAGDTKDTRPPETAEEKQRRLRKESRRKLRVSFRPDHSLTEVRFFTHDPDEELGHDASMTRDVADVGGEGRMFKQHHDTMDIDDDDDDAGEETLRTYSPPSLIDFTDVDKEERDRNYAPYGGGVLEPGSPEKAEREKYEANILVVFYTDRSEIPPCPREPADPYNGEASSTKSFGAPAGAVATRSAQLLAAAGSTQQAPTAPQQPSGTVDVAGLLAMLNGGQQQPAQAAQIQQPPQQTPQPQGPTTDLQSLLAKLTAPQQTAPAAPSENPSATPSFANILASLGIASAQPAQQQAQVPAANNPVDPANLTAYLGQFNQGTNAQSATAMPHMAGFGFPGVPFNTSNMAQTQQQPQQQQYPYENEERRRLREGGENNGYDGSNDYSAGAGNQGGRFKKGKQSDGGKFDNRYTVPCKYWPGKCLKGDKCTFLHG